MASDTPRDIRDDILDRLTEDLLGPTEEEEVITDRPSDRYLTGILFPVRTEASPKEDDSSAEVVEDDTAGTGLDSIRAGSAFRPSSAGLSFAVQPNAETLSTVLVVTVEAGRYLPTSDETSESEQSISHDQSVSWQRVPRLVNIRLPLKEVRSDEIDLGPDGLSSAKLHMRMTRWEDCFLVTLAVSNEARAKQGGSLVETEQANLFQTSISVECDGGIFVPKPERTLPGSVDKELSSLGLLYRNVHGYAVGHNCSAEWESDQQGKVTCVATTWLPQTMIHPTSAEGDDVFSTFSKKGAEGPLAADSLCRTTRVEIIPALDAFVDAYELWIDQRNADCSALSDDFQRIGERHLEECRAAANRMRSGVRLLETSDEVLDAFRLANRAIALQQSWKQPDRPLVWRPFQIGFALLCLRSLADPADDHRETMDLLWFPTGGGKTEAYLLLSAFTIFLRRIRAAGRSEGAGVTAFMRYTLRLLTIQQFERASALICACELIRRGSVDSGIVNPPEHFTTDTEISVGLWVGSGATSNKVAEAIEALGKDADSTPDQLRSCPCCHTRLNCEPDTSRSRIEVNCTNESCPLFGSRLPVWTVDENIYEQMPTLVIGTADKYAQIVRSEASGRLFGIGTGHLRPELIIQDELHLISGPLGSLAGLYEVAVDELCRQDDVRAKVIGSTATIRRAEDQVNALFDRGSFQFPPPGLDATNSGFAVEDQKQAGRRFIGVSTIGRSAKFTLQATEASLLQTAANLPEDRRDGYWTVVNYFNSLRELGGALVLMRDDVARTLAVLNDRRETDDERHADSQVELTSRIPSNEIPAQLKQLEARWNDEDAVDIVLASNMISVGMDVSRLGLMVVNGQPKTVAEYIQATSRVGRSSSAPGLVLTIYNANKVRDRGRYETFNSWHQALYREVEATSVTPFAKRARDRALHAPLVAIVRHLCTGMSDPTGIVSCEDDIRWHIDNIVGRIREIDEDEAAEAGEALHSFVDQWLDSPPPEYWHDHREALLISAERYTERGERAFHPIQRSTPNSLRSVEAATSFLLERSRIRRKRAGDENSGNENSAEHRTRRPARERRPRRGEAS